MRNSSSLIVGREEDRLQATSEGSESFAAVRMEVGKVHALVQSRGWIGRALRAANIGLILSFGTLVISQMAEAKKPKAKECKIVGINDGLTDWRFVRGQCRDGYAHGPGKAIHPTYPNGVYVGGFAQGKFHGMGTITFGDNGPMGCRGEFVEGVAKGSTQVCSTSTGVIWDRRRDIWYFSPPKQYRTPNSLYVYAGILERDGRAGKDFAAKLAYEYIVEHFPDNPVAVHATERLAAIRATEEMTKREQRAAAEAVERQRQAAEAAAERGRQVAAEAAAAAERQRLATAQAAAAAQEQQRAAERSTRRNDCWNRYQFQLAECDSRPESAREDTIFGDIGYNPQSRCREAIKRAYERCE